MILYFADRKMNILGQASTSLPEGVIISNDRKTEEVDEGVAILEFDLEYDPEWRKKAEAWTEAGNYILRKDGDDREFYTIISREKDPVNGSVNDIYAEDAGLDLLNEVVGAYKADKAYSAEFYIKKFSYDSGFEVGVNEVSNLTRKLSWDGEATATERLLSVATQFDNAEISFSFDVDRMSVVHKYINIFKRRGVDSGVQLQIGREIKKIRIKDTIEDLATAYVCTGGIPDGKDDPITLAGYKYDDGDFYVEGTHLNSRKALQKWSRYQIKTETGDNVGHIVKTFSYDTTSQSELCNRAVSSLKKICDVNTTYEVELSYLPQGTKIGDTVYIIDHTGELYLSSRLLKIETSVCDNTKTAELGEYSVKSSGVSEKLRELADAFAKVAQNRKFYTWIAYADDDIGTGASLDSYGKEYLGIASNRVTRDPDLTDPTVYTWIKIRGEQGIPGTSGKDGKTSYFHVKYSDVEKPASYSDMTETPAKYIGTYVDYELEDSKDPSKYTWSKFQGEDGTDGIPGKNGENGETSYVHFAYATSEDGKTSFSTTDPTDKTYIGQYVDFKKVDSEQPEKYRWSKFQGPKGPAGSDGEQGYGIVASVTRENFTEDQWNSTYGMTGHLTSWTGTSALRNGCRIGDIFVVVGTATDTKNAHTAYYRSDTDAGDLQGICIGHTIAFRGSAGIDGTDGKGIESIKEHYAVSTSNTVTPTVWFDDVLVTNSVNKYLWSYETIIYTDGTSVDSNKRVIGTYGDTGKDGATGADGKGIKSTAITYQAGSSGTTAPTGTWQTTVPATSASSPYLWTRTIITYTDNTTSTSYAVGSTLEGVSVGGRNLIDGTHKSPVDYYYPSSSYDDHFAKKTTIPLNGDTYTLSFWAKSTINGDRIRIHFYNPSNIISVKGSQGQITSYGDGLCDFTLSTTLTKYWVTYTIPKGGNSTRNIIIPRMGADVGGSGKITIQWEKLEEGNVATDWTPAPEDGIASVDVEYYLSTSATSLSGGSWSTTAPAWVNGKYMWSRTVTTDGTGNKTYSPNQNGVCIAGAKGDTGNKVVIAERDSVFNASSTDWWKAYCDKDHTDSWTTFKNVSDMNAGDLVYIKFHANDVNQDLIVGYKIISIVNNYVLGYYTGLISGINGATGATGVAGKGVSSIVEQYYKSTSATALSGGSWGTTYPGWESGKYIWTRSVITYTDKTTFTTTAICVTGSDGRDGVNGTNLWINPLFESDKPQIGTRDTSIKAPNGSAVNLIDKRDNYNSNANFPVFPGHSYRITVHRKKKSGSVNLKAGIWYIAQTSGHSFDTYVDASSTKNLSDGWQEAVYNITCPNGKSKGCVFLQLEKTSTTDTDAAWYVANIICTDITGLKGDKGDTGATGATGATGSQGYGIVANVVRENFTETQWSTYGAIGHEENWGNTSGTRNGCRVGDIFTITGNATDTRSAHVAYYKSTTASGDLHGICMSHTIAPRGATGPQGAAGPKGDGLDVKDTRSTNESPSWYMKNYPRTTVMEFKECKAIGLSNVGIYCNLQTIVIWGDSSGGYPRQTAKIEGTGKEYWRVGTSDTTWSSWIDPYGKSIEAAKTATNFMEFTSGTGLQIGDKTNGSWKGFRSRITSTAFEILNEAGSAVASYGRKLIQLGKDSVDAVIELCGGKGSIKHENVGVYGETKSTLTVNGVNLGLLADDSVIIRSERVDGDNTTYTSQIYMTKGRIDIATFTELEDGTVTSSNGVDIDDNIGIDIGVPGETETALSKARINGRSLLDFLHPVGSIYMSTSATNPTNLFGGTWVAWGAGRVPVGFNGGDGNFNSSEKTGGSKTINIQHNHGLSNARAAVGRADSSTSTISYTAGGNPHNVYFDREFSYWGGIAGVSKHATDTAKIYGNTDNGGSTAASVLQPYITCYMWKRTA